MNDKTISLTNGLTLTIKSTDCLYCGQDIWGQQGAVFLVFPMDLLYDPHTKIDPIGYLAHSYCLTEKAMYFKSQMMSAMRLGWVTEIEKPEKGGALQVYLEEQGEDVTPVPVGTKRGPINAT
jgi:hypothetical protein